MKKTRVYIGLKQQKEAHRVWMYASQRQQQQYSVCLINETLTPNCIYRTHINEHKFGSQTQLFSYVVLCTYETTKWHIYSLVFLCGFTSSKANEIIIFFLGCCEIRKVTLIHMNVLNWLSLMTIANAKI